VLVQKKIHKILVPLDGSNTSLRGLEFASTLAQQSGLSIMGLNIYSFPTFVKNSSAVKSKIIHNSEEILKNAQLILQKNNVSFTGMSKLDKNIGKAIVTFANSNKIDLIVIGSHGPDPEFEIFLGSVANYVINKSKIPVTIIK